MTPDQAISFQYKGAWDECIMRVRARDQILLGYMTVSGTLLGVALSKEDFLPLVLVIPYLALIMAFMSVHHEWALGALTRYLTGLANESALPKDWFTRKDCLGHALWAGRLFTLAQFLALAITIFSAIGITRHLPDTNALLGLVWHLSLPVATFALGLIVAFRVYRDIHRQSLN